MVPAVPRGEPSPLREVAEGVWIDTAPVRFMGLRLTANMTVLRLASGGLLLHSPIACTAARREAVDALGRVTHLFAPNTFHHLRIGDWASAYPAAKLHAPRGLLKKRPDLRIDRLTGTVAEPAFAGEIDEVVIGGFRLEEATLYHRRSGVLVVADLLHNVGRPTHLWTRLYSQAAGFYGRVGVSRVIRYTAFTDLHAARRAIDVLLSREVSTLVVGHGEPISAGAHRALAETYGWLPPGR